MDDKNNKNSVGYVLGSIFGATCIVCATVAVIALTIKFITWII